MKTRILDVKNRYALLLSLALGLMAARPAMAACDVTLSSILPGNQVLLKANCGTANMTEITWFSNGAPLPGFPFVFAATQGDLTLTATLTGGNQSYTASGFENGTGTAGSGTAVTAGKAAVISLANLMLTVAGSTGGTVTSNTGGISCLNGGGTCSATYAPGAPVTLTAAPDGSHSFSGWGGDCSGTSTSCVVSMTTSRTVTATFGAQPVPGACASPGASSTPPTNLCTTGTPSAVNTANNTYSWTCAGPNNGSTASCSAPQMVAGACGSASGSTPLTASPSGTAACATGTVANMATGNAFTWSCNGINGGASTTACLAPIAATNGACGSANNSTVASAPTGTAACSAGTLVSMTNPSNTFSWSCNGLAGGSPQSCTAYQSVNGACGSANGTSVSSAPTGTAACSVGSQASLSGSGPWSWSCTGVNNGSTASCSATLSAPPPTSTACQAPSGWTCAINPLTISNPPAGTVPSAPLDTYSGRTFVFTANPNVVHAFPITFDSAHFPGAGASIGAAEAAYNRTQRDMVISDAPGKMTPLDAAHFGCRQLNSQEAATIFISFDTAVYGACNLTRNTQYWLNVKATSMNVLNTYLLQPFPQ